MTIEQHIIDALSTKEITADALAALIVETEAAIAPGRKGRSGERIKALDPLLSPDPCGPARQWRTQPLPLTDCAPAAAPASAVSASC